MSNENHACYQEKLALMSSGLADVVAHMEHISASCLEIMNKVKLIRAIVIIARVNEMNKIHEGIGAVEDKMHNMLENSKYKRCVLCTTNKI